MLTIFRRSRTHDLVTNQRAALDRSNACVQTDLRSIPMLQRPRRDCAKLERLLSYSVLPGLLWESVSGNWRGFDARFVPSLDRSVLSYRLDCGRVLRTSSWSRTCWLRCSGERMAPWHVGDCVHGRAYLHFTSAVAGNLRACDQSEKSQSPSRQQSGINEFTPTTTRIQQP